MQGIIHITFIKNNHNIVQLGFQVFYTDNQMEDVSLTTFDTLARNEAWRLQVLLIQGYIPASSTIDGNYARYSQVCSSSNCSAVPSLK
jgi:hypothetical protein